MKGLSLATYLLLACTLILSSCGSHKKVSIPQVTTPATTLPSTAVNANIGLEKYSTSWERLKIPMTLRLNSPKSISVSGQTIMERGKSITLSLKFLGMEVGVIHITSDSVFAMDKFNKKYLAEGFRKFLGGFPLTMTNVQDLLLGHPFLLGSAEPVEKEISKFSIENDTANPPLVTMIPDEHPNGMEYGFTLNSAMQLAMLIIKAGAREPVTISYGNQVMSNNIPVTTSVTIEATAGKTAIDADIEWNTSKIKWNSDVELRDFTAPKGYQRIDAEKLLKGLKF
ncbi:MAG: DUF4292 domain-containing protein [Firmicutes bacterium]|nr:DUF4292 domain-containing protein [Bacillota bacterium]MCM1401146.1 DUF4292 domain-containing protein [Bacteroides sp.]MCM1477031.1 DUF4292 domain-containing protein [Bacteroides sp.]